MIPITKSLAALSIPAVFLAAAMAWSQDIGALAQAEVNRSGSADNLDPATSVSDQEIAGELAARFSTTNTTVLQMRRRLPSWEDVITALTVSRKTAQSPESVATFLNVQNDWNEIAARFGLDREALRSEVQAIRNELNTDRTRGRAVPDQALPSGAGPAGPGPTRTSPAGAAPTGVAPASPAGEPARPLSPGEIPATNPVDTNPTDNPSLPATLPSGTGGTGGSGTLPVSPGGNTSPAGTTSR